MNFIIPLNSYMARFHTIASQSNHMQTYYSNNKKDSKVKYWLLFNQI